MINRIFIAGILIYLALFTLFCSRDMPISHQMDNSNISFVVSVDMTDRVIKDEASLAKVNDITKVVLTVSGPDMDTITKTLSGDGDTFTGTIEVPKGNNRTFDMEARDARGIAQFDGSVTQNIQNDNETISLELEHIPSNAVTLQIISVNSEGVVLSWTQNTDSDFDHYRIVRSTSSTPTLNDDKLEDIDSQYTTQYSDYSIERGVTYYYQVWVVDTEYWGTKSNTVQATIPATSSQKLYYDDGTFESYFSYSIYLNGFFVKFTPPSTPCRIDSLHFNLKDDSGENGGNYYAVVTNSSGTDIFWSLSKTTYTGTNWVNWLNLFDTPSEATVYDYFYVGIQYARTDGWPKIGVDQSSTVGNSMLYISSDNKLYYMSTYGDGYPGNLGIRVSVTLGNGQKAVLCPDGYTSRNEISKKIVTPKLTGQYSTDPGNLFTEKQ
ncbi:fibronectin type III domain-containing protein [candidate division KSB1 bacterium]|nr:fibronectin type III domain-containing protein [candidate division KSB1 bacterium]